MITVPVFIKFRDTVFSYFTTLLIVRVLYCAFYRFHLEGSRSTRFALREMCTEFYQRENERLETRDLVKMFKMITTHPYYVYTTLGVCKQGHVWAFVAMYGLQRHTFWADDNIYIIHTWPPRCKKYKLDSIRRVRLIPLSCLVDGTTSIRLA